MGKRKLVVDLHVWKSTMLSEVLRYQFSGPPPAEFEADSGIETWVW